MSLSVHHKCLGNVLCVIILFVVMMMAGAVPGAAADNQPLIKNSFQALPHMRILKYDYTSQNDIIRLLRFSCVVIYRMVYIYSGFVHVTCIYISIIEADDATSRRHHTSSSLGTPYFDSEVLSILIKTKLIRIDTEL